ncbi:ion channel [Haloferula rosea]|uniref:Potassium channel domain-containing protein n=1 Tax=Haloferula rosea TaxID=490093 RepID=A0A934R925_9BACT|nr:ion channel [Haloferula rosea]MBK1826567.1 hypothetical protein [Haloferula rosea]
MLVLVTIAAALLILNFIIQLGLVSTCIHYLIFAAKKRPLGASQWGDNTTLAVILLMVLAAHLLQIALWAVSFMWIGEFELFRDAFYHSAVNFASLGYGDVVMSEEWRLLGALEAAAGVMMFGVSAALLFAILSKLIRVQLEKHGLNLKAGSSE